jgi:phenylacetate-CoA ligase
MMNKLRKLVDIPFALYYQLQLRKYQWKDLRQLEQVQFKKLKAILKYAYYYVPYYHRLFSNAKIKPEDIRNFEDMRKIPSISKQGIQRNFPDMMARGVNISRLPFGVTSGSTGTPLKVIRDNLFTRGTGAVSGYILFECGVRTSDNFVTVWGRGSESIQWGKKYARLWGAKGETVVPLFPPSKLVNVLRLIKPDVLNTFPSVLCTLANYDVSGINPRMVFTQGELVTQHFRDLCQKMLGSELFETYGSVEFGNLAFECNEHCGLHMITNSALMEFVDETGEYVSSGEQGEIVVTGFLNHVMPFIRYRIGDLGIPTDEKCACGRSWPLIKSIQGRINDYLVLPSGRKITWLYLIRVLRGILYDRILRENVFTIAQYQIIQKQKDRIILKLVKGREFNPEMLEQIRKSLEREFDKIGEKLKVVTQIVDEIPMERTGKRRILISKIAQ